MKFRHMWTWNQKHTPFCHSPTPPKKIYIFLLFMHPHFVLNHTISTRHFCNVSFNKPQVSGICSTWHPLLSNTSPTFVTMVWLPVLSQRSLNFCHKFTGPLLSETSPTVVSTLAEFKMGKHIRSFIHFLQTVDTSSCIWVSVDQKKLIDKLNHQTTILYFPACRLVYLILYPCRHLSTNTYAVTVYHRHLPPRWTQWAYITYHLTPSSYTSSPYK